VKAAGIREFKAHLSRYLEEVRRGEVILVTDRGKVVAEVRKPLQKASVESVAEQALVSLAERGEVRLGRRPRGRPPRSTGIRLSGKNIDRFLEQLRAERGS